MSYSGLFSIHIQQSKQVSGFFVTSLFTPFVIFTATCNVTQQTHKNHKCHHDVQNNASFPIICNSNKYINVIPPNLSWKQFLPSVSGKTQQGPMSMNRDNSAPPGLIWQVVYVSGWDSGTTVGNNCEHISLFGRRLNTFCSLDKDFLHFVVGQQCW